MNLIFRRTTETVRIPSYNEIAPKLGVARSSAQLALKQLIREGYLTAKVGIGTFSNPRQKISYSFRDKHSRLVGLIVGDGKYAFYPYSVWMLVAEAGKALARHGIFVQLLTLNGYTETAMADEIANAELDGLIWIKPFEQNLSMFRKLAEHLPVTVCGGIVKGLDSAAFDEYAEGEALARELLRLQVRRLLVSGCFSSSRDKVRAIRDMFRQHNLTLADSIFIDDPADFPDALESLLRTGELPDTLLMNPEETPHILAMLAQYKIDVPHRCRLVSGKFELEGASAPVLAQPPHYDELGRAAVGMLLERMAGFTGEPRLQLIVNREIIGEEIK